MSVIVVNLFGGPTDITTIRIRHDYPQINAWLQRLYHREPGFKESTDFQHIKVSTFAKSGREVGEARRKQF